MLYWYTAIVVRRYLMDALIVLEATHLTSFMYSQQIQVLNIDLGCLILVNDNPIVSSLLQEG